MIFYWLKFFILDELINGFDFVGMKDFCDYIKEFVEKEGIVVLFVIYLLCEVEDLCDCVIII